ncbi:MAG: YiiD C-terminal domain-containing protein [Campylobacterota bacterium]|nr:YiiD C-terminal domain-containing protein [Campylobacterota bacterium]
MDVTHIPFARHTGIERKEEGTLKLEPTPTVQNHINSIHASAQFTLAETQSGLHLQSLFPTLENKVVAVLRGSTVKYKSPATTTLTAEASIDKEIKEKFLVSFEMKGRASITVKVKLLDEENTITMIGEYNWFISH